MWEVTVCQLFIGFVEFKLNYKDKEKLINKEWNHNINLTKIKLVKKNSNFILLNMRGR